jgi:hypothetical protein
MSATISGSNPPYSLQSILTADITAVRDDSGSKPAAPAPSTDSSAHAAPAASSQSAILSTLGIGASVNHQG